MEVVLSEKEKSNEENGKVVLNINTLNVEAEIKESTKNDIPIALEIDYHNVTKLEAKDEENAILEGFSLEANSFMIIL